MFLKYANYVCNCRESCVLNCDTILKAAFSLKKMSFFTILNKADDSIKNYTLPKNCCGIRLFLTKIYWFPSLQLQYKVYEVFLT